MKKSVFLIALAFVVLKLTSAIDWSWWLVLSPIPISFTIGFIKGFVKSVKKHAN